METVNENLWVIAITVAIIICACLYIKVHKDED